MIRLSMIGKNMSLIRIADETNSVFMFELTKRNFSSLSETWSQTCNINNLTWQIRISKTTDKTTASREEYLSVYLFCEPSNYSELWCCTARVRLVLRSLREGVEDYSREFVQLFSSNASACGYPDFLRWTKVIDPNKGYVVDDVIKVQAHIDANAPQNVDPDPDDDRECPQNFETWKTSLENGLNFKIVSRISEELKELSGTVELGQKNVVRILSDNLKITLDSAIAPVLHKTDLLQETLRNISTNGNSVMVNFSKEDLIESMGSALCPVEHRILTFQKKIEKIFADNVATLVNQSKLLDLKDEKNNVVSGTMADKDEKNTKKASTSDGEPILLSILKILHELRNNMKRESLFRHRHIFPSRFEPNSDDPGSCNGCHGFSNHNLNSQPDAEHDHMSYNRLSQWQECSPGRSTPCSHSSYYSNANESHSQRKQNRLNLSCASLPHLFQKNESNLVKRKCDETESNFSTVSCDSIKLQALKSELLAELEANSQYLNSTEAQKENLLLTGIDEDGEVKARNKTYTLKELYSLQRKLEKFDL